MSYKVTETPISDLLVLEPTIHGDERGFFMESFNQKEFCDAVGTQVQFVQDNHSRSRKRVLRGLHYQVKKPQGKLVRVVEGAVFDVAVDIRRQSSTFGQWFGVTLTSENHKQFWVPAGFAHGFVVLTEKVDFLYKTTEYYAPEFEKCIVWDDPDIGIDWNIDFVPQLSIKDQSGTRLEKATLL